MLEILGRSSSINVRKVLWLCAELALPFRQEAWGTGFRSTNLPEFLALNPNGLVPVIRDGAFVLWESNAICRYLAARQGRDDLLPGDLQSRAIVEQWIDWQATELNDAWRYAFMGLVRKSPAHGDPAAIAASIEQWNRRMTMLGARLEQTGAYVAGETFTLADIGIGVSTHRWFATPIDRPALPAVDAYYERLSTRPGFREHVRNGSP
jgi:glutathione S-transferase